MINIPFEKMASVSQPYNLPPEKMVFIELYDMNEKMIGREIAIKSDDNYYERMVENILRTRVYDDLLDQKIKVLVKTFPGKILYIFGRKPKEKELL